jgi:hypothetical protein
VIHTESSMTTCGDFASEPEAWEFFDREAERSGAFKIYREVSGTYVQPRPGADTKGARIDRILVPTRKLIEAGWDQGPFGVEGKRSGLKVGKLIAQALDYSRCVWEIQPGFLIMLRWTFVYPIAKPFGDLESVMAQNRIGWASTDKWKPLSFNVGATCAIAIESSGELRARSITAGNKTGNRS